MQMTDLEVGRLAIWRARLMAVPVPVPAPVPVREPRFALAGFACEDG